MRIEREGLSRRTDGLELELIGSDEDRRIANERNTLGPGLGGRFRAGEDRTGNLLRNDHIDALFITTKANQTIPALRSLVPRLSSNSTVVICQNGMGTLEGILDRYWPDDTSGVPSVGDAYGVQRTGGRPSFICATTTHGMWRKGDGHYVHAGRGDIKFGVIPNGAVLSSLAATPSPSWGPDPALNPIINPRSLILPELSFLPSNTATHTFRETILALLRASDLRASWLPLPSLQIAQLQKLAVNISINALTAVLGVHNGALVGSPKASAIVHSVTTECALVFSAHLAREEGRWEPPPLHSLSPASSSSFLPPPLPPSHPLSAPSLHSHTLSILFHTSQNVSSTLADLLATDPSISPSSPTRTETDFMHGYLGALGTRYGIPTPVAETLGTLIKLKEEVIRSGAVDKLVGRAQVRSGTESSLFGAAKEGMRMGRKRGNGVAAPVTLEEGEDGEGEPPRPRTHPYDRAKKFGLLKAGQSARDARLAAEKQRRYRGEG